MALKTAVLLIAIVAAGFSSSLASSESIDWHTYDGGMARSKFEKKTVLLYFYADWCTYCAEMERKTFKDPTVVATLNRSFIPIRVDSDRDQHASALFRVKSLPDTWFLSEKGDIIGHRPGFIPADQLLKIINVVLAGEAGK
jgi:thioredoxin-related protein